jgi:hypothetical protein
MKTNKDADEKPTSARAAARSLIDPAHHDGGRVGALLARRPHFSSVVRPIS